MAVQQAKFGGRTGSCAYNLTPGYGSTSLPESEDTVSTTLSAKMYLIIFCFLSFLVFSFLFFSFVLFCFVLFCFVLFCFVLFCFVLFCFVLFCFVLFCFVLFCFGRRRGEGQSVTPSVILDYLEIIFKATGGTGTGITLDLRRTHQHHERISWGLQSSGAGSKQLLLQRHCLSHRSWRYRRWFSLRLLANFYFILSQIFSWLVR